MPLAVCATPIGNLEDVTLRVLATLRAADVVLCEDTRHTAVLLARHGIRARQLLSYHRHNEARRVPELIPRLEAGELVALVSDAGLPGVNDPGEWIVRAAITGGVPVTVLPGASAVETALVASGLAGELNTGSSVTSRGAAAELDALWRELARWPHPAVAFESPRRLPVSLGRLAALDPARPVAVCRELTKRFEEVVRGTAGELVERFAEPPKGEVTVVVGAAELPPDTALASRAVARLVEAGASRRMAAEVVAELTGLESEDALRPVVVACFDDIRSRRYCGSARVARAANTRRWFACTLARAAPFG